MWGVDCDREDWLSFVCEGRRVFEERRHSFYAMVPGRSGRYSICDTLRMAVRCFSQGGGLDNVFSCHGQAGSAEGTNLR